MNDQTTTTTTTAAGAMRSDQDERGDTTSLREMLALRIAEERAWQNGGETEHIAEGQAIASEDSEDEIG